MTKKINLKLNKPAEEMFRMLSNELASIRISRDFEIELENGDTITINKWIYENEKMGGDDNGWEILEGNEIYNKMSEEKQDKFYDFVSNLNIII